MEEEDVTFIDLNEGEKVFLCLQFLLYEDQEVPCFTEYGRGIVKGLMDETSKKKCEVILRKDYETMKEKLSRKWWHKSSN